MVKKKALYLVLSFSILGLILVYGIYIFSKQQISLRNGGNSSYVVSNPSNNLTDPTPIPHSDGPSGFLLESSGSAKVGQTFTVKVLARSDADAVNLLAAKMSYPKDLLQVVSIDPTGSVVSLWVEKKFDNQAGTLSIIGGIPNPGFKTNTSDKASLLATITFKSINSGNATIGFLNTAQVFRNQDNQNILNLTQPIVVTIAK